MKRYEGLFLFDTAATRDWATIDAEVRRLCERIGASLLVCVKFDERRLAFEIKGRKRGTYALAYFDAPPERIGELERDAQLSELILRLLVLRAEGVSVERIAELQARSPDVALSPSSEGRRHDDGYGGEPRRGMGREERGGSRYGDAGGGSADDRSSADDRDGADRGAEDEASAPAGR